MMSTSSLCSSSTLLASSTNNSICEVTDIETDCPSDSITTEGPNDQDSSLILDPPQVSISSHDSPDHDNVQLEQNHEVESVSSVSIYESPLSSIYETPVSSPTYATPMEGSSPWASPRSSLKSVEGPILLNSNNNTNKQPGPQRGDVVNHNKPFTG